MGSARPDVKGENSLSSHSEGREKQFDVLSEDTNAEELRRTAGRTAEALKTSKSRAEAIAARARRLGDAASNLAKAQRELAYALAQLPESEGGAAVPHLAERISSAASISERGMRDGLAAYVEGAAEWQAEELGGVVTRWEREEARWERDMAAFNPSATTRAKHARKASSADIADQEPPEDWDELLVALQACESGRRHKLLGAIAEGAKCYFESCTSLSGMYSGSGGCQSAIQEALRDADAREDEGRRAESKLARSLRERAWSSGLPTECAGPSLASARYTELAERMRSGTGPIKEGWLCKHSSGVTGQWKWRYFTLSQAGELTYVRSRGDTSSQAKPTVPLITAAAKRGSAEGKKEWCFSLISPKKTYTFQAPGPRERDDWLDAISVAVCELLHGRRNSPRPSHRGEYSGSGFISVPGNHACADCGAADPAWASVNLGVLLCQACAGAHRQLGSHVSSVRSVCLDSSCWEDEGLVARFMEVGSVVVSDAFEGKVGLQLDTDSDGNPIAIIVDSMSQQAQPEGKPTPHSNPGTRVEFAKKKYAQRGLVQRPPNDLQYLMRTAVRCFDARASAVALALGASSEGMCVHVAAERDDVALIEILARGDKGAEAMLSRDSRGQSPLHKALEWGNERAALTLLRRGVSPNEVDGQGRTALSVCMEKGSVHDGNLLNALQQTGEPPSPASTPSLPSSPAK